MPAPLYRKTLDKLQAAHPALFAEFHTIHEQFRLDQVTWQSEFNRVGKQLTQLIDEADNRLCSKMENSRRGKFSERLSDLFRAEVRSRFPLIDLVGVTIN